MSQVANWCFTLNNHTEEEVSSVNTLIEEHNNVQFLVYGFEVGENGTPHLQGYIEMKRSMRLTAMKQLIPRAHFEPRMGTQEQAIEYCTKDGQWYEFGKCKASARETKKNLLQARLRTLKEKVEEGADRDELFDTDPVASVLYNRWLEREMMRHKPPISRDVEVILIHGEPGTNKTRMAHDLYPALYAIPCNTANQSVWFDGMEREHQVLLDDFSGEMPLVQLLRLLDRYRLQVPYKGGHCWFCPDTIIITSNVHPRKWYDYDKRESSWHALKRRIHVVYDFNRTRESDELGYRVGKLLSRNENEEEFDTWFLDLTSINDVLMPQKRSGLFIQ